MQVCFNCQELVQMGQLEEEGRERCLGPACCISSLLGAPDIKADAIVGVGDGAKDGLVPLAAQAPLTGTPVVNPIDGLQREGGTTESQTTDGRDTLAIFCSLPGCELDSWHFTVWS